MKKKLCLIPVLTLMMSLVLGTLNARAANCYVIGTVMINMPDSCEGKTAEELFNEISVTTYTDSDSGRIKPMEFQFNTKYGQSDNCIKKSGDTINASDRILPGATYTYSIDLIISETMLDEYSFVNKSRIAVTCNRMDGPLTVSLSFNEVNAKNARCTITFNYTYPTTACESSSDSVHVHDWTQGVIYEATQNSDGLEGTYCRTCGTVKESHTISAYAYSLSNYAEPKIHSAKPGQSVILEFGEWNSFPKSFMEKLVDKSAQGTDFIFKYNWNHKPQTITIPAGTPINLDFDYYGPAKMAELYGMY